MPALLLALILVQSPFPTLRQVLYEKRLGVEAELPASVLNLRVDTHWIDGDEREIVLAFVEPGSGAAPLKSHVIRWDVSSGRWQHADISEALAPGNAVIRIRRSARFLFLDSTVNPSAGRLVVLSRDLAVVGAVDGFSLEILPDESVLFHHSQIHFAPTHSFEMSVFYPEARTQKQIYPPTPFQPVRIDFIRRVAAAYKQRGETWFRENKHHMDPEMFDSALQSRIMVDRSSNSFSFSVRFGNRQNARDPLEFTQDVLVNCSPLDRVEQLRCFERPAQ